MNKLWYASLVAFIITAVITPIAIPILRKWKFGQSIRDIGPSWHKSKAGTPTMGGIAFAAGIAAAMLIFNGLTNGTLIILTGSIGCGLIGFLDDYIKIALKRNLGLRSWQKLVLQLIAAIVFIIVGMGMGAFDSSIVIPFTNITIDLGLWYMPFAIFFILGTTNAVNLTDGVDGLASSVTAVIMIFFCASALIPGVAYPYSEGMSLFAAACIGGLLGFLLYNSYPAKIFMGDTGSLFLGGAVATLALMMKNPLIVVIAGFVYFIEALSVIIQVASFKLTGKRVFKMSPIHHHFEMCGWSEVKIVSVFSIVCGILSLVAYYGVYLSV
ncbi:MAG: phospho-N-acetylmuramoyl-pentapeptide-transferase [Eubacteriales bacterium]|nr:phospho-N-acetylmuramoyl-pentapeptide-transferase [Eubacteriales bacterium]